MAATIQHVVSESLVRTEDVRAGERLRSVEAQEMASRQGNSSSHSMHNGRDVINEKLPAEVLLLIFRGVTPSQDDAMAPIRLTHVCRSWRILIHQWPAFWLGILNPADKTSFTYNPRRFPFVLIAFEKSQPVADLAVSLHGAFLSTLCTIPDHASRISTLWLDCSHDVGNGMDSLFDLHLPRLERLSLWFYCERGRYNSLAYTPPVVHFPRLSYLRTNCMQLALKWMAMNPGIRSLVCGGRYSDSYSKNRNIPLRCCRFNTLSIMFKALERCSNLEELEVKHCFPTAGAPFDRLDADVHIHLWKLKFLRLCGDPKSVRDTLERLTFPDTARIALRAVYAHRSPSDLLPRRHVLPVIPQIRSLVISVSQARLPFRRTSILGEVEPGDKRLSLLAEEVASEDCAAYFFDLFALFRGLTACYSPMNITRIRVECYWHLDGDGGGYSWLYSHHPRVIELVLDVFSPGDALSSLGAGNVLEHLEHLTVVIYVHETSDKEYRTMMRALEVRAACGLRLRSLSFTQEVDREVFEYGYPSLTVHQIARLDEIVEKVSIKTVVTD
ncbi:hypothetical protein L226DRAFT_610695 [Lentinus tigrinus ALCF2SS1-7]|uniref:uncharacterized protein n=1 Tax=Lentinus tigrinus ALCF2SS1-7 TaxID=1328758 RepID=UPI001165E30D|nr:hypothetical protein L226DRAFT_610695 [Lentinus tigrinus ALCF2SS1-7]